MLALFTDLPRYCPQCGHPQSWANRNAVNDYHDGCSFDCISNCGFSYAYTTEDALLGAATANGTDLEQMLRRG